MQQMRGLILLPVLASTLVLLGTSCGNRDNSAARAIGLSKAKVTITCNAMDMYFEDYPSRIQGFELSLLTSGNSPYLSKDDVFTDEWGNRLVLRHAGDTVYVVKSLGQNGVDDAQAQGDDISCVVQVPKSNS